MSDDPPQLGVPRIVGLLIGTAALLGLLGYIDLFGLATQALTGDGEVARIQPTRLDPMECDVRFGENLVATQRELLPPPDGRKRIVFLGNSQQYTASLPRAATPDEDDLAEMASALFDLRLQQDYPDRYKVYSASAPNQTFPETLWQLLYWFEVRADPPAVIVLQASFDTFRKTGIRIGFRTLLEDPAFDEALARFEAAHSDRAWRGEFGHARQPAAAEHDDGKKRAALERTLRSALENLPLFAKREARKQNFLLALYFARVQALGISPTTRRHIVGQALHANMDALDDIVALAREHGAKVIIYNAPTNPSVSMFYEEEYEAYLSHIRALADSDGVFFADLGAAVSKEKWGYWVDGPDPIHFDRSGHVQLAESLAAAFLAALAPG